MDVRGQWGNLPGGPCAGVFNQRIPEPLSRVQSANISARTTLCPLRNLGSFSRDKWFSHSTLLGDARKPPGTHSCTKRGVCPFRHPGILSADDPLSKSALRVSRSSSASCRDALLPSVLLDVSGTICAAIRPIIWGRARRQRPLEPTERLNAPRHRAETFGRCHGTVRRSCQNGGSRRGTQAG